MESRRHAAASMAVHRRHQIVTQAHERLPIPKKPVYFFWVAPAPLPTPSNRTFWQRRVADPVVAQLTQGITPEKIALTIAVGSALALYPMLGVTTLFCFLAGVALRLNQPIIQVINYLCFPVHLTTIYYCWHWGDRLFGTPHPKMLVRQTAELMWHLLWNDPVQLMHRFGTTLYHATVVWALLAPLWIIVIYYSARTTLREIARIRAEAAKAAAAKVTDPGTHPVP
jgi:uncharacterized protein (DUF2062 family)